MTLTKAKRHALERLQQEIGVIEQLAPLERRCGSAVRKKKLEQAQSAFRTHCPTLAIPIPPLGTFYDLEEYLKNARTIAAAIQPLLKNAGEQENESSQGGTMMHHIHLYGNHYRVVSDEGYAQFLQLIEDKAVCQRCHAYYTPETPRVSENICLPCFLRQREGIRYLGPIAPESPLAAHYTHCFLSEAEHRVHLTQRDDTDWKQNGYETLRYYGYPLPPVEWRGQHLSAFDWTIYGDVESARFLFAVRDYSPSIVFLVYKGGQAREFSMRTKADRQEYERAREQLKAEKKRPVDSGEVYTYLSAQLSAKFTTFTTGSSAAAEPTAQEAQ